MTHKGFHIKFAKSVLRCAELGPMLANMPAVILPVSDGDPGVCSEQTGNNCSGFDNFN